MVIDVGKTAGRQAIVGAAVSGSLGTITLVAGLSGGTEGGAAVVAMVLGVLFLLPAILVVAMSKQVLRPRKLVFEAAGVRWDDPQGQPWAVEWRELAAVSVSKHSAKDPPLRTVNDMIVDAATDKVLGERAMVRLDLYPGDEHFGQRHPQMAPLWGRQGVTNGYRLPLGNKAALADTLDRALVRFAPGIYRGVVATKGRIGLS